jgi:hypothetical protein
MYVGVEVTACILLPDQHLKEHEEMLVNASQLLVTYYVVKTTKKQKQTKKNSIMKIA